VRAALHADSRSYGLTLEAPALDETPNPHLDIKSSHKRFSSRLDEFVRLSHGVVVAPGGIGTLLELMYVWQLLQVGMIDRRPVVLLGALFWNGFLRWVAGTQAAQGFLSPLDLDYLIVADSIDEVVQVMAREQEQYQGRRLGLGGPPAA
jgi:predicted Rossmann-fold nucleotide-binding protein